MAYRARSLSTDAVMIEIEEEVGRVLAPAVCRCPPTPERLISDAVVTGAAMAVAGRSAAARPATLSGAVSWRTATSYPSANRDAAALDRGTIESMLGAVVASAVIAQLALRTRRHFAWDDPMIAAMLVSASLMVVMCSSLLFDGRWKGALFLAPLAAVVVVPAVILGREPAPVPKRREEPDEDDDGGGGGGPPPEDPRPGPPEPGIDWDGFDELRESWGRSGARPSSDPQRSSLSN